MVKSSLMGSAVALAADSPVARNCVYGDKRAVLFWAIIGSHLSRMIHFIVIYNF